MRASVILLTYNRPPEYQWLPEGAIESFLRQDHPDKEVPVLNDCPAQRLICNGPGITVVNLPCRFRSIGERRNAAIGLSAGEVVVGWDDDVSLPWRISTSVRQLERADDFCPSRCWVADAAGLHHDCCLEPGRCLQRLHPPRLRRRRREPAPQLRRRHRLRRGPSRHTQDWHRRRGTPAGSRVVRHLPLGRLPTHCPAVGRNRAGTPTSAACPHSRAPSPFDRTGARTTSGASARRWTTVTPQQGRGEL